MKHIAIKYLSLVLIASAFSGLKADRYYENGTACAERNSYECACNPLYCGASDIQIQGGVAPVTWRHRGLIHAVNCTTGPNISEVLQLPKFNKLFKTPWTVGVQLGHAVSDNSRVYIEFNYTQAKRKTGFTTPFLNITPVVAFAPLLSKYRVYDFYVGARYYWDRWCDRVSFFLGGKIGFASHKRIRISQLTPCLPGSVTCSEQFCTSSDSCDTRHAKVAGGANLGVDICFCGGWSFVITGEVVASCAPNIPQNIVLGVNDSFNLNFASNLLIGTLGTQLRFPVTFGLRYTF